MARFDFDNLHVPCMSCSNSGPPFDRADRKWLYIHSIKSSLASLYWGQVPFSLLYKGSNDMKLWFELLEKFHFPRWFSWFMINTTLEPQDCTCEPYYIRVKLCFWSQAQSLLPSPAMTKQNFRSQTGAKAVVRLPDCSKVKIGMNLIKVTAPVSLLPNSCIHNLKFRRVCH